MQKGAVQKRMALSFAYFVFFQCVKNTLIYRFHLDIQIKNCSSTVQTLILI